MSEPENPIVRQPLARIAILAVRVVTAVALLAMVGITIFDVVARNFVGFAMTGVIEIVELSLVWFIFLGIALAAAFNVNIVIDIIDFAVGKKTSDALKMFANLISLVVFGWLAHLAIEEYLDVLDWGDATVDIGIPVTWYWAGIICGFALATIFCGAHLIQQMATFFSHFRNQR
ncbi:hypothetical protein A8B82_09640 [Sulfitobacter sp. EhC04]|uniref:TRAP transporter small permease n=1 Tax=Sulfitobacter sp. EhC04 TaxID=1849168 RepID=UPI0007F436EA|nr:TRAP transporter small permease [Sulfitobacter sp. EhC04]OAN78619.1 hypothetical protein A8B82_09640 [Sulfitobacter sp. EhC04]